GAATACSTLTTVTPERGSWVTLRPPSVRLGAEIPPSYPDPHVRVLASRVAANCPVAYAERTLVRPTPRLLRRLAAAVAALALVGGGGAAAVSAAAAPQPVHQRSQVFSLPETPGSAQTVRID